ncbi:two-component regulator propeller domain-containing protein [Candidatus Latescibacterota bacterium]
MLSSLAVKILYVIRIYVLYFLILLPGSFFSLPTETSADEMFRHFTTLDGLSGDTVTSVTKDQTGFMWIGTSYGLNRYDGYNFKKYHHMPHDPSTLSSDQVLCLFITKDGTFWVGTQHGLNRYNREADTFTRFLHDPEESTSLSNDYINSIYEDYAGNLWIGTQGGLNMYDLRAHAFHRYSHNPFDPTTISEYNAGAICEDHQNRLWIGTSRGLNLFNRDSNSFSLYELPGNDKNAFIGSIIEIPLGVLWLATWGNGLYKFDTGSMEFTRYAHDPDNILTISNNLVGHMDYDSTGNIWIGTNGGLNRFDIKTETFSRLNHDQSNDGSISSDYIWAVYTDNLDNLWIGTSMSGLNQMIKSSVYFSYFRHNTEDPNSLSSNEIGSFGEISNDSIWIGTASGIDAYDRLTGEVKRLPENRFPETSGLNSIHVARDSTVWLGTNDSGIIHLSKDLDEINVFSSKTEDVLISGNDWVFCIEEDAENNLWFGTYGGLLKYDNKKNEFSLFVSGNKNTHLTNQVIHDIAFDRNGRLWIGSENGLNLMDTERERFAHFLFDPDDPKSLSNNNVYSIKEDYSGNIWIGTAHGFNLYNNELGQFTRYTELDGLPNNVVRSMEFDYNDNLWIGTDKGISRFNTVKRSFLSFDYVSGLPFNYISENTIFRDREGNMFVGGNKGFFVFHPDSLKQNKNIPPVLITSIRKYNEEVSLDSNITYIDNITLSHKDDFFSFEFAALDFTAPEKNRYRYLMEGLHEDWIDSGTRRFASYTNIPPGHYEFQVIAANSDGQWNEKGASIRITVTPPLWGTLWFRALIGAGVIGLIFIAHSFRVRSINKIRQQLKKQVNKQTEKLQKKSTELETLFQMSPDTIIVMDSWLNVTMANKMAKELLGCSSDKEIFEQNFRTWICDEYESAFIALLNDVRDKGCRDSMELIITDKIRREIPVEIDVSLITGHDDTPDYYIVVIIDISKLKKEENERVDRERLKGIVELAGGASHNLNQPLQTLLGYTELAQSKGENLELTSKLLPEIKKLLEISQKLHNVTQYKTKTYINDTQIVDIDESSREE